jgi:hypothetical protein
MQALANKLLPDYRSKAQSSWLDPAEASSRFHFFFLFVCLFKLRLNLSFGFFFFFSSACSVANVN